MNKFSWKLLVAAAGLIVTQGIFAADGSYPRLLNAAEIQKLYGDNVTIDAALPKGRVSIQVQGNKLSGKSLDAFSTQGSTASMGTWKVDESANKVCHSWENKFWKDTCFLVRQTGPDSYEYTPAPTGPGFKLTISH